MTVKVNKKEVVVSGKSSTWLHTFCAGYEPIMFSDRDDHGDAKQKEDEEGDVEQDVDEKGDSEDEGSDDQTTDDGGSGDESCSD